MKFLRTTRSEARNEGDVFQDGPAGRMLVTGSPDPKCLPIMRLIRSARSLHKWAVMKVRGVTNSASRSENARW